MSSSSHILHCDRTRSVLHGAAAGSDIPAAGARGARHPHCLAGSRSDPQHAVLALGTGLQQLSRVTLTGTKEKGLGLTESKLRKLVATRTVRSSNQLTSAFVCLVGLADSLLSVNKLYSLTLKN